MNTEQKRSFQNGTIFMDPKSSLTVGEVCTILEASAKAGVTELSFGDLQIKFGLPPDVASARMQQYPLTTSPVLPVTDEQHQTMTKDQIEADEVRLREEFMEELRLTDPFRYEQMLVRGELDDPRISDDDGDEVD